MHTMPRTISSRVGAGWDAEQENCPLVAWLQDVVPSQRPRMGGKAANLAALVRAGLPVPAGFCITTSAFEQFLEGCPRRAELRNLLSQPAVEDADRMSELSRRVQSCLAETVVPSLVSNAVLAAWRELGGERGVAVRSSATVEDAAERSFAGQFESVLKVQDSAALFPALKSCWLSLFSGRALVYLAKQKVPLATVRMAVVVQEMVEAEHAGVVFTADPLTGATDRLVAEYVSGLGDKLVQGMVQPERVVLEKQTGQVLTASASHPPISLEKLARLARETERLFGASQDIEWAQRDGCLFLLQARPLTVKPRARTWEERQVWSNMNTGEIMPDVVSPMTWSLLNSLVNAWLGLVCRLAGSDLSRAPIAGLVAGRLYFNANTGLAMLRPFLFLFKEVPNGSAVLGGWQFEANRQTPLVIAPEDVPELGFSWPKYILSWPRILFDVLTHSPHRSDAWAVGRKVLVDELARIELEALSTPELMRLLGRVLADLKHWDLLYLVTQSAALPVLQKACRDWVDVPGLERGYRLFSGLGGLPTMEAGLALWRLAVLAHADAATQTALTSEPDWARVRTRLAGTAHGAQFLAAWHEFMTIHGHHCRGELELFNARWAETPDYILEVVRGYLGSLGSEVAPLEQHQRLGAERERLTEQCRQHLRNPLKRWLFNRSLRRSQKLVVNREVWKNMAVRQFYLLRRILLTLGERLQRQGALSSREDVFFLELPEVEAVVAGNASFDWRERILRRRREYEQNTKLSPPPVVIGRFDPNVHGRPTVGVETKVLEGLAVSPGVVSGRARIILRTEEHQQVLPGEILVAPFTDPAWTPYFVTAAGVVMDQGGLLSHGSIVAREYGLPAVTNVGLATQLIHTGDLIEVDGSRGRVTILKARTRTDGGLE